MTETVCPECGARYPVDARLCPQDGSDLVAAGATHRSPGGLPSETPAATLLQPTSTLTIRLGSHSEDLLVGAGILLGRALESSFAGVLTPFGNVSRDHCHLKLSHDVVLVTDLSSSNGTFIDDVRLEPNTPTPLRPGSRLRLARDVELELRWS